MTKLALSHKTPGSRIALSGDSFGVLVRLSARS